MYSYIYKNKNISTFIELTRLSGNVISVRKQKKTQY